MPPFKFLYKHEVRRVFIKEDQLLFSELMKIILNLFPSLKGKSLGLLWEDDVGDLVGCSSDVELDEAIRVMSSFGVNPLKFHLDSISKANFTDAKASNVIHTGITCDECGLTPIVGVRYHCTVRPDFDLCEACEAKNIQSHAMIKIVYPSQIDDLLPCKLQSFVIMPFLTFLPLL